MYFLFTNIFTCIYGMYSFKFMVNYSFNTFSVLPLCIIKSQLLLYNLGGEGRPAK